MLCGIVRFCICLKQLGQRRLLDAVSAFDISSQALPFSGKYFCPLNTVAAEIISIE